MMQPFIHFFIVFCLYTVLHNSRSMLSNFFGFHTSGVILSRLSTFLLFSLVLSNSSSINCLSLMLSWSLIIFSVGLSVISRGFPNRFLKSSFYFRSLFPWVADFSFALNVLFLHLLPVILITIVYLLLNFRLY